MERRTISLVALVLGLNLALGLTGLAAKERPDRAANDALASVSGTIRHDGSPVAGVAVAVTWTGDSETVTTGDDGMYSVSGVPTGGEVTIAVRPPIASRLAFRNWRGTLAGNLVKDFDLVTGYRLQGEYRTPAGAPYTGGRPGIHPVGERLPAGEFCGPAMNADGSMDLVLPPGFYDLYRNPEVAPYFLPPGLVDPRNGDLTGVVITLSHRSGPIPSTPPVAQLITVGPPDAEGFATVTGAAGSVAPLASVLVANLSTKALDVTGSDAAGAFTAELYAPPGSSLLVKYDVYGDVITDWWPAVSDYTAPPLDPRWGDMPGLPGAMLYAGERPPGTETWQAFDGAAAFLRDSPRGWAGLWLSGKLETDAGGLPGRGILPGETITLTASVRVTSPDVTCSLPATFTISAKLMLQSLYGVDGRALPWDDSFSAYMFTPTGLPIEHAAGGESTEIGQAVLDTWTCSGAHVFQSELVITATVPATLAEGVYLPRLHMTNHGLPLSANLPLASETESSGEHAFLPPLVVGEPQTPRLPTVLFADHPSGGHRTVQAREDEGHYQMQAWVVFPPEQVVLPRLDERTGEPIRYQLEPGCGWLAQTDRRLPNPLRVPLDLPSGALTAEVIRPDGRRDVVGPAPIRQSSLRNPTTPGGVQMGKRTGTLGDVYHLRTMEEAFAYSFDCYGPHTIHLDGEVLDVYGNGYRIQGTYEVLVARLLDLEPAGLAAMPFKQGDAFAPGLHVFPAVPATVTIQLVHMPLSDPMQAITRTVTGQANRFGYFQPPPGTEIRFQAPGEFRADVSAVYIEPDGTLWAGHMTWGNVVEGLSAKMEAHGRRGMDYTSPTIDDMPAWFFGSSLRPEKTAVDTYYPYFSGDVYWGGPLPFESIQPCVSVRDLTGGTATIYNILRANVAESTSEFRRPPSDTPSLENLEKRIAVGEAPLFIAVAGRKDPSMYPDAIKLLAYWYGTSERPGVRVREAISQDMWGVGYWGFDDTYNYQLGVPADGDQVGDLKWNFGGAVVRTITTTNPTNEYAIYASLWTLIAPDDPLGSRITPPFQDVVGSINGGPILVLDGQEIDMLFLPLGIRPGDILELGDAVAFSGLVGPPLDSRVAVTVTAPSGAVQARTWHANKIGWLYDPASDFVINETGRWAVGVHVEHDRPYLPTGMTPQQHNTGTVLGTDGSFEFYVVPRDSPRLRVSSPRPGVLHWPNNTVEPVHIRGIAPSGTSAVHYTIFDKGVVMGQDSVTPDATGAFTVTYDAEDLHQRFPMLSLTAREGLWEGLADEVAISLVAMGSSAPQANTVTLIGEEVFVGSDARPWIYLPLILKRLG